MPNIDSNSSEAEPTPRQFQAESGERVIPWIMIAVFAGFLASFPIRNSELFGHLASGRILVESPGVIASSQKPTGYDSSWHESLFDVASYLVFNTFGGSGLGFFKSLAMALLAIVTLSNARVRGGWLMPLFATGLAMLSVGSRMLYRPETFSYLFAGILFWILLVNERKSARNPEKTPANPTFFVLITLILIFVFWGLTDHWFKFAIPYICFGFIGHNLDLEKKSKPVRFVKDFAICALVIYLVSYPFPVELFASGPMPGGTKGVMSPFSQAYLEAMSESPAGMAIFPLMGLSAFSFVLRIGDWKWKRFLPWLFVTGLVSYQVRTAPFFAVIAGPILAWNLQDFFANRAKSSLGEGFANSKFGRFAGRVLVGVLGIAFLASAWVGWMQSPPFEPRRLGIEISPSLESSARVMANWNKDGRLGTNPRLLHLASNTRQVFAWYAPELISVANVELAAMIRGDKELNETWLERMRSSGATHLVVYDNDRPKLMAMLDRLFEIPAIWELVHLQGRVAIFKWNDPEKVDPSKKEANELTGIDAIALTKGNLSDAIFSPSASPDRRWWDAFWKHIPPSFDDRDEASIRLLQAEVARRSSLPKHVSAWEATQLSGLIASLNGWSNPAGPLVNINQRLIFQRPGGNTPNQQPHPLSGLARAYFPEYAKYREDSPAALLYLAIRSARQALARNPRDAQAHANLGEAYLRLVNNSRERGWGASFNELVQLRRAQAIEALNRAVELDKDQAYAHSQLGAIYREMGFLDLSLEHSRAYISAIRRSKKLGMSNADFQKAMQGADELLDREAKVVEENRAEFERSASGLRVFDRAILARDLGLAGLARDILLKSDISAFGANGLALELELLVKTGRARDARDWSSEEQQAALGANYHWLRVQALAATGDYELARAECRQLGAEGEEIGGSGPRLVSAVVICQAICDGHRVWDHPGLAALNGFGQSGFRNRLAQLLSRIRRDSDAQALRAVLSLEMGDISNAESDFRNALINWQGADGKSTETGVDFNARLMCQKALEWIESVNAGPVRP